MASHDGVCNIRDWQETQSAVRPKRDVPCRAQTADLLDFQVARYMDQYGTVGVRDPHDAQAWSRVAFGIHITEDNVTRCVLNGSDHI